MAESRRSANRGQWTTPDADGTVRLIAQGDRLVPAPLSATLPLHPAAEDPVRSPVAHVIPAEPDLPDDPVVLRNRARLRALHAARSTSPAVAETFFAWFWTLFVFLAIAAAAKVLLELGIAWAAGVALATNVVAFPVFCALLDRHERAIIVRAGGTLAPRPSRDWRELSPPRVARRARAHLAALTVDDTELEDRLDALVRPGCNSYDLRPPDQRLGRAPRRQPR